MKYKVLQQALLEQGQGSMKCFGNSMTPKGLKSGSLCTFQRLDKYAVGDIVFCKVKGRYIDAHQIIKIHPDGRYLIANGHGFVNGWTGQVFGKVIAVRLPGTKKPDTSIDRSM